MRYLTAIGSVCITLDAMWTCIKVELDWLDNYNNQILMIQKRKVDEFLNICKIRMLL